MEFKKQIIVLGPTAVGKTEVSVALAEEIGGEIISADSMQVYRGMDVATAKPTPTQRARVPHHLIDVLLPPEPYSAARFRHRALELIREIKQRGRRPLIAGGSALYIKVLVDGLFESPPCDWAYRRFLEEEERKKGSGYLFQRLLDVDPVAAERIHINDIKRIIRALEVYELTGIPISRRQQQWKGYSRDTVKEDISARVSRLPLSQFDKERSDPGGFLMIGLRREREDLYNRINQRVEKMFKNGLVKETKKLLEEGADRNRIAWQALGYKEVEGFLRGDYSLEEAQRRLARDTRHFAKRQLSWWRRDERIHWFDLQPDDSIEGTVEKIIELLKGSFD